MPEGFKMLGDHVEGCLAAQHKDGIAFIVHDGATFNRRRDGRRGGSTMWHRFICNDTKCGAVMIVRWDTLAAFVNSNGDTHD